MLSSLTRCYKSSCNTSTKQSDKCFDLHLPHLLLLSDHKRHTNMDKRIFMLSFTALPIPFIQMKSEIEDGTFNLLKFESVQQTSAGLKKHILGFLKDIWLSPLFKCVYTCEFPSSFGSIQSQQSLLFPFQCPNRYKTRY